jgi:apolipoprotein N-acyltransferase
MAGAVRAEGGTAGDRYYNSIVAIGDAGEIVDAVDKVHLVPGGEYLPLAGLWSAIGIDRIVPIPMSFAPGSQRHPIAAPGGVRIAPFICYEIIFPELVAEGAATADLIVNVTNDAWFGDTPGPYQHFRQAQIRAVETGRIVVRAANTGISGVIDAHGRVLDALAINARGVMDLSVELPLSYTDFGGVPRRNGFAVMGLLALLALGMNVRQRLRIN